MPIKHEVGRFRLDSLEPSAWCLLFAAICMVYKAAGRLPVPVCRCRIQFTEHWVSGFIHPPALANGHSKEEHLTRTWSKQRFLHLTFAKQVNFRELQLNILHKWKNKPCHLLEVVSGKLNINQGCTNKSPVCNFAFTFPKHFQGKYGRKSWPNMQHEFSKPKLLHCKNFYLQNSSGQKDRLFSIMSLCPCACCAYCWCW